MLAAANPKPPTIHPLSLVGPLLHVLTVMWPLWVTLAVVGIGRLLLDEVHRRLVRERLRQCGLIEIDGMSGPEFERRLTVLFRDLGFEATLVGMSGDFGCDLLVTRDGRRSAVQAKCWRKDVGIKAVQEVIGAKAYYGTDGAMVVTNRHFTKAACELAASADVKLWDRDVLVKALRRAGGSAPDTPAAAAA